jgi:hypothetical protein
MAERYYEIAYQNYVGLLDSLLNVTNQHEIESEIESEIKSMRQDLLPRETTLQYLTQFLSEHREFVQNPDYLDHLSDLFKHCQENMDEYKSALDTLFIDYNTPLGENEQTEENDQSNVSENMSENDPIGENEPTNVSENKTNCYAEASIDGTLVSWNTHNDPVLALLYPIFLTMFGVKYFDKIPEIVANLK